MNETSAGTLDTPVLPEPALTLQDFDSILGRERAIPAGCEVRPLDPCSYAVAVPGAAHTRVTTDGEVFEYSADNQQLFSFGGQAFEAFAAVSEPSGAGDGVAWLIDEQGVKRFIVQTEQGAVEVRTAAELLNALERVGSPAQCSYATPNATISMIA